MTVAQRRPTRRASARAGVRNRHQAVPKCVSLAIENVLKQLRAERRESERERINEAAAHRIERAEDLIVARKARKLERDDKAINALIEQGRCAVSLKLQPPEPEEGVLAWLENRWNRLHPLRFTRHEPGMALVRHMGPRWVDPMEEMRKPPPVLLRKVYAPPRPPVYTVPDDVPIAPRESEEIKWVPPPLPANEVHRDLNFVDVAAAHVAKVAEAEWLYETRMERSRRQKAHGCKSLLGMSDAVFYKHLRDNVVEPREAYEEVHRRKMCISKGESATYGPPEGIHPMFGLMDEEEEAAPAPPPSPFRDTEVYAEAIQNPWKAYLASKTERMLCEAMATKWVRA